MRQLFSEIARNRELIVALALQELRVRYKRSVLGFFWALLNPLFMMIIMTVVFTRIMRVQIHAYSIFMLSALLPWTLFVQSLSYSVESIVGHAHLLKKMYIDKSIFPVSAILANIINFVLSLIPLLLLVLALRFPLHWTWIYLPVPLAGLLLLSLGFGFFVAAANVFFRDVAHIVQIVLQGWFYLSPVIYSIDFVPHRYQWLFHLNPMIYSLNGFRLAIYYGMLPSLGSVGLTIGVGAFALFLGYSFFRRYQDSFVFYV
jgi:ABC-2 type transport system permease protein